MKQPGHEAITRQAVAELYRESAVKGRVLGLTEKEFADRLNNMQAAADSWLGPTWLPYIVAPGAQSAHSLARSGLTGDQAVVEVRDFITTKLVQAKVEHDGGSPATVFAYPHGQEWMALGYAVHSLEDSYSGAHTYRDPNSPDDPYAPILGINVFGWINHSHHGYLDKVPLGQNGELIRPTDIAAKDAVKELLHVYVANQDATPEVAAAAFAELASSLIHGQGVHLSLSKNDAWWQQAHREALEGYRSDDWSVGRAQDPAELESRPGDEFPFSPENANSTSGQSGGAVRASYEGGPTPLSSWPSNSYAPEEDTTPAEANVSDVGGAEFFVPEAFGVSSDTTSGFDLMSLDPGFVSLGSIDAAEAMSFTPMEIVLPAVDLPGVFGAEADVMSISNLGDQGMVNTGPSTIGDYAGNVPASFDPGGISALPSFDSGPHSTDAGAFGYDSGVLYDGGYSDDGGASSSGPYTTGSEY